MVTHIKEEILEVIPGSISLAFKSGKGGIQNNEMIVKIIRTSEPDHSITQSKIRIVVTDSNVVQECLLSSKYLENITTNRISPGDIIKIGERAIGAYHNQAIIYIKEIISVHKKGRPGSHIESIGASPAKRKIDDTPTKKEEKKEIKTIKELNPFKTAIWNIRVRAINKSPIREYSKDGRTGKVFNLLVSDGSTKCSIVFFTEFVDSFYEKIHLYKSYDITGGVLKLANKRYNEEIHDYEIIVDRSFAISPAAEVPEMVKMPRNIVKISRLSEKINETVSVLGVVVVEGTLETVTRRKDNTLMKKKTVTLGDDSEQTVQFILWEESAEMEIKKGDVLLLENVRVSEYQNEPQISMARDGEMFFNPEVPEVFKLKGWFNRNQDKLLVGAPRKSVSGGGNRKIARIEDVKEDGMEYATIQCSILFISDKSILYNACPNEGCKKKVEHNIYSPDSYHCAKCNMSFENCTQCYNVSISVGDESSSIWVSLFDGTGKDLFHGMDAVELFRLSAEEKEKYLAVITNLIGSDIILSIRGRETMYKGEPSIRYNAMSLKHVDYLEESNSLLSQLKCMS